MRRMRRPSGQPLPQKWPSSKTAPPMWISRIRWYSAARAASGLPSHRSSSSWTALRTHSVPDEWATTQVVWPAVARVARRSISVEVAALAPVSRSNSFSTASAGASSSTSSSSFQTRRVPMPRLSPRLSAVPRAAASGVLKPLTYSTSRPARGGPPSGSVTSPSSRANVGETQTRSSANAKYPRYFEAVVPIVTPVGETNRWECTASQVRVGGAGPWGVLRTQAVSWGENLHDHQNGLLGRWRRAAGGSPSPPV